ncbi:MAG: outer membrane beta-barrel protein, partial [Woeseiaceae bacterium]|nr:outer membrane beta-barrel protein [Woeseiaceae bacterium]
PALVVLALCGVVVPGTAQADEHMQDTGFYAGIAVGSAAGDVSASQFSRDLSAAGYDVSDVSLDDSASGWKLTLGYMLNSYLGLQVSYVDLGDLRSELTASVSPDDVDDLLRTAAGLLPGRGEGILADLLLQYPLSERVAVYATLGVFFAEPETEQVVISGGSGSASRADEDNDFAGSIGLSFAATRRLAIKVGYERYDIDGSATDFPAAGLVYRFGGRN